MDFEKLLKYLRVHFGVSKATIFTGYLHGNQELYSTWEKIGYSIIYKTVGTKPDGAIKGNCDAELVLQATSDYYEGNFDKAVILSSDGDFSCLCLFLLARNALEGIVSPSNEHECSYFLKQIQTRHTFLPTLKKLLRHESLD